uniref:Ceramide synthase 2-like n=1 Tax=Hirondellea gigas TaxID=1518452 RepID=A0A2P2I2N1_9CRUS
MSEWFWNEWFWLPHGYTWDDLKSTTEINYPSASELLVWPPLIAVALLCIRQLILIPLVFRPLGKYYGIRSKPYMPPVHNEKLDKLYSINRARPPRQMLEKSASDLGMSSRQVERWLRRKTLSQQMTTLEKFTDHGWQVTYYSIYCIAGLVIVTSKPWYVDNMKVFENYPVQNIPTDIWWYYMTAIGFYIVQSVLLFKQDKKHDFYQMLAHHCFTIVILNFCWITNTVRICATSLLFHECSDIPLSLAKLFLYAGKLNTSNTFGAIFFLNWIPTRLYLYPMYVMRTSFYLSSLTGGSLWPAAYILQASMTGLFVLHLMWTMDIIPYVIKLFKNEKLDDPRSSPEELSDDDETLNNNSINVHTVGLSGSKKRNDIHFFKDPLRVNGSTASLRNPPHGRNNALDMQVHGMKVNF